MNLNEFAQDVHALAVEKGFYDNVPTDVELIAAIHGEISEAFEEWRAGRPMVWHECVLDLTYCEGPCTEGFNITPKEKCNYRNPEPHGIVVELIDVVLRVLDFIAGHGLEVNENDVDAFMSYGRAAGADELSLPRLVISLHYGATLLGCNIEHGLDDANASLNAMLAAVFTWIRTQDIDPEALMLEKHEYNKTRPYRHGGKRI